MPLRHGAVAGPEELPVPHPHEASLAASLPRHPAPAAGLWAEGSHPAAAGSAA